jgi:hypothetical protein
MDAPVEELGAPAEPLGPSGAPDVGSAIHTGQSRRARPKRSRGRQRSCWPAAIPGSPRDQSLCPAWRS